MQPIVDYLTHDPLLVFLMGIILIMTYLLWDHFGAGVKTKVRVEFSGSTEKEFKATESEGLLSWKDNKQPREAKIITRPRTNFRWGRTQRIFYVVDGVWTTTINIDPDHEENVDKLDTNVLQKMMRTGSVWKQLAAGLVAMDWKNILIYILLGLFAGMWLAPLIEGALAG